MSAIELRRIVIDTDAHRCAEFFSRMLDVEFSNTFPETALASFRSKYDAQNLAKRSQDDRCVLLTANVAQDIVGLIIASPAFGGVASIDWLVVDPSWRGRGLGKRLLARSFEEYASLGAHKVVLYTETEAARRFYESSGMSVEGVHPKHWWELTHYCLTKTLSDPAEGWNAE